MSLESFYLKCPYFIQSLFLNIKGCIIKKRRFNKSFLHFYQLYTKKNTIKTDQVQLKKFIKNSLKSTYWNQQFKKYKVNINADNIENELTKLPILYKKTVIENAEAIYIPLSNENEHLVQTSGSTGTPLKFYETQTMENKQWAIWWRYRSFHGIKLNTWCAWFGGKTIMNIDRNRPPYWHTNFFNKQLMFSAHHLSLDTVESYFNKLKKSNISWMHGYPSQISFFASLIEQKKLKPLNNIKVITLGAENLMDTQLTLIKKVFNAKVVQHYGLAEGVANISQNLDGEFKVDKDFSLVRFIPSNRNDNSYKIIGTNYNNLAFPLINYDTGDMATIVKTSEGEKIISIDGRSEDFITLPNGIKLGRLDHIFKNTNNIVESQLYQKKDYTLVLRIVKGDFFSDQDKKDLLNETIKRVGTDIKIEIEFLDKIKRKKSGKLKFVISEIKN